MVQGLGLRVEGVGFRVSGSAFRVSGLYKLLRLVMTTYLAPGWWRVWGTCTSDCEKGSCRV